MGKFGDEGKCAQFKTDLDACGVVAFKKVNLSTTYVYWEIKPIKLRFIMYWTAVILLIIHYM